MKRYTHSAIILLAALSLVGCSKTVEFQNNPDSTLQIESVSGISPFTLMQEPVSRAVISGESLPNNESAKGIGLFVTAADGGAYDGKTEGFSNVRYTFNGERWSTTTPVYLSKTEGKLYGYFPYSGTATDLKAIPVASSLNGTDYLYAAPNDVSYTDKSVSLQMNHALARFHLTIKKGDKYLKDCDLSKIAIESTAIDSYGTMDITMGTVAGAKTEGETGCVVFDGDGVKGTVTEAGIEKDILLVPAGTGEGKKDLTLTLTIDGSDAKINFSEEGGLDIRSGIQCNATIEIQDSGIKVIGVGVGVWVDGGSQQVQVDGHTVTVKLSDDEGIADDVLTNVKIDGSNVIIRASSFQGRNLVCNVGDNAKCERLFTNDKFTFIISEICSNIEAVLGYAPLVTLNVQSDSNGKVWIGDDDSKTSGQFDTGQQVVIHASPNDKFRFFRWNDNNRETSRTITVGELEATYSASFISSDLIPGLFTVNSDGKQVFFSKGNLWYGKLNGEDEATFHLESNQYESTPSTKKHRDETHISHFMWCDDAANARALSYNTEWNGTNKSFFAGKDFTVDGVNTWFTLTSGDKGEWVYLINRKNGTLCKYGVKVCSSENCLILLPDNWNWGENGVGSGWLSEYNESTTVKWSTMENAGAVCLPAAGYRLGNPRYHDPAYVDDVGNYGYYWSASPDVDSYAYDLNFHSSSVFPSDSHDRLRACSVRLVTDISSVVPVESVSLDKTTATLSVGGTTTLTATVLPDNATDKSVSWSSSNADIATVDETGKVTAISEGTATITVTTVDGGKTATCAVTVKAAPAVALPGVFTVADDGQGNVKKVHFSQGNLTYDVEATTNKWKFYEHQYDCAAKGDASSTLISLFTWGYSASTSLNPKGETYVEDHTTDGDKLVYDKASSKGGDDWGVAFCESNNITVGNWRTLSKAEWQYLFNTRKMENGGARSENLTSSGITVEGVTFKGIVLFPDDFTEQTTWKGTYTTWEALNDAGIVFLPAAGRRSSSSVLYVGAFGYYWSSTAFDWDDAYHVDFDSRYVSPDDREYRSGGFSVRLITECQ